MSSFNLSVDRSVLLFPATPQRDILLTDELQIRAREYTIHALLNSDESYFDLQTLLKYLISNIFLFAEAIKTSCGVNCQGRRKSSTVLTTKSMQKNCGSFRLLTFFAHFHLFCAHWKINHFGPANGPTDRRTDTASHRVTHSQHKI